MMKSMIQLSADSQNLWQILALIKHKTSINWMWRQCFYDRIWRFNLIHKKNAVKITSLPMIMKAFTDGGVWGYVHVFVFLY